jgi:putative spermidine/putrescine transport system ATP-binding protein
MSTVVLDRLSKQFGTTVAVADVTLQVAEGELVALLGPSGCGKTTTLRMVAGFVAPTAGRISIGARDVTQLPPHRRDTGMVFQSYALFPHMTVAENVAFGLEMRRVSRDERARRVAEALRLVRLDGLADRFPRQLSGGQQQRVALARALVVKPGVFLLDEPLSNLDAKLRAEVRIEIRALQQRLQLTTLFVTHDQEEALTMADRLVVMNKGVVQQVGRPEDLYERPANAFVAGFIGKSNFFRGRLEAAGRFRTESGLVLACDGDGVAHGAPALLAVRPERIAIDATDGAQPANLLRGTVSVVTYLGASTEVRVRLDDGTEMLVVGQTPPNGLSASRPTPGAAVGLAFPASAAVALPMHDDVLSEQP